MGERLKMGGVDTDCDGFAEMKGITPQNMVNFLAGLYEKGFAGYYMPAHRLIPETENRDKQGKDQKIVSGTFNSIAAASGESKQ